MDEITYVFWIYGITFLVLLFFIINNFYKIRSQEKKLLKLDEAKI